MAQGVNNFISTSNTFEQQRQAQANILADQQFRAQQAEEDKRRADRLFNFQVDQVAYDRVAEQYNALVANLKAGAFDKDPLLKERATYALAQSGKIRSLIGKGQRPDETMAADYDQLWVDFGELAAAAGINLGVNASLRDDATTTVAVNAAAMSDYDVRYTRDTLPKKIEGFNAAQDVTILNRDILAAIAPLQTVVGKAEALAKIASLGGTSAGAVQGLVTDGLIDPDTAKALQTRMGQVDTLTKATTDAAVANADLAQANALEFKATSPSRQTILDVQAQYAGPMAAAGLRGAQAAAGLSEQELAKVSATLDSTVTAINANNDYQAGLAVVQKKLLGLTSAGMQAKLLSDLAVSGGIGAQIVKGLLDSGDLDPSVAAAVTTQAERVEGTEAVKFGILLDTAQITSNDRLRSDAILQPSIDLFNSDAALKIKTNEAAAGLLELRTEGERAAYLQSIAKMGAPGVAILDSLKQRGIITAQQAGAFKQVAGNAQAVDDALTQKAQGEALLTSAEVEKVNQTLTSTISAINSTNDLTVQTNTAKAGLLDLQSAAQRAEYLAGIAATGPSGAAIIDGLAKQGAITSTEASGAKTTASNAERRDVAATSAAETGAAQAAFNLDTARQLFPIQLASARTALNTANEQLAAFREGRPFNLALLKAQVSKLEQDISQNAQLFGPQLDQALLQVQALRAEVEVAERTVGARVTTAIAGAGTAVAQSVSAGVQAQVDVATIPDQIRARQLSVGQAQAALDGQLLDNRFADATFGDRVRAINISTAQGRQQLLALKQQYSQNAQKFPAELKHLNAQIAIAQEQVRAAAAERLRADGTVSGDPKVLQKSLEQMRIINGGNIRVAQANLRRLQQQYLPNARFSVDKWDNKQYTVMSTDIAKLPPEVQQQFRDAAAQLDMLNAESADLQKAFAGAPSGKIDPKVAERLGLFVPGSTAGEGGVSALTAQATTPGTDLTKLGLARDAVFSGKDAKGNPISYCSKFARQFTAKLAGQNAYGNEWQGYFKGTATETLQAFRSKGSVLGDRMAPRDALGEVGRLKEGDLIFLMYGNSAIDHVAVYDGKGGIIQHSLPGFRGQTIQGAVNTMSLEQFLGKAGRATVSFGRVGGVQQGPPAPTGPRATPPAKPAPASTKPGTQPPTRTPATDVAATLRGQQLGTFYAAVRKAPNTAAAQKLLQDKAIALAGGPNAPQALKAQYFEALLAEARK